MIPTHNLFLKSGFAIIGKEPIGLQIQHLVIWSSLNWMKKETSESLGLFVNKLLVPHGNTFKSHPCDGINEFLLWNVRQKVKMYTRNTSPCLSSPDAFADLESPTVTPDRNDRLGWSWVGGLEWCKDDPIVPPGGGYQERCVTYLGKEESVWDVYLGSCYTYVQGWHTFSWLNSGASVWCVFRILLHLCTGLTHY